MEFYGDDFRTTAVLVTLKTALALFSIWIGLSSLPWFWRGLLTLAVIALLFPPRAYDPGLGMLVQVAVVAGTIGLVKRGHRRQALGAFLRWRFQLADLFRGVFLLSLALALTLQLLRQPRLCEPIWLCLEALSQGVLTLLVAAIVFFRQKLLFRIALLLPLVFCWLAVSLIEFRVTTGQDKWDVYITDAAIREALLPPFFMRNGLLAVSQFLALIIGLFSQTQLEENSRRWLIRAARGLANLLILGSGICSVVLILFLWWTMTFLSAPPQIVLPHPNGYETAQKAARLIQGDADIDPDTVTITELTTFVRANQQVISLAHDATQQHWQSPLTFDADGNYAHADVHDLRKLLLTLNLSVRLALREKRMDDAVNEAVIQFRLGSCVRNGGLITDFLIGRAFESVGVAALKPARADFDSPECRRLVAVLKEVERRRSSIAKIAEIDRVWTLHHGGYQNALVDTIRIRTAIDTIWLQHISGDAEMRLLAVDLAIRAYRLEQGQVPGKLDELVPEFFAELPRDPFTERSFIYRRDSNDKFVLYAAGPDGDDDGGKSMSWQAANTRKNGDFFLDCWDEMNPASKPPNAAP